MDHERRARQEPPRLAWLGQGAALCNARSTCAAARGLTATLITISLFLQGYGDKKLKTLVSPEGHGLPWPFSFWHLEYGTHHGKYFKRLNSILVDAHVEKKGVQLPQPFAVQQLRLDPTASWRSAASTGSHTSRLRPGTSLRSRLPSRHHAVADSPSTDTENRPISAPTCFEINRHPARAAKATRCTVWAVCMPGGSAELRSDSPAPVSQLAAPSPASTSQLRYIRRLVEETGHDLQRLLDYFSVSALDELSSRAATRAIKSLQKHRRAA